MNKGTKIFIIILNVICILSLYILAINFFDGGYSLEGEVKIVGFVPISGILIVIINMLAWLKKPNRIKKLENEANILKKQIEIKALRSKLDSKSV